jgi:2-amino-4-hydroxy-6-hydroxymethyldihydropteridine diphosphokinase
LSVLGNKEILLGLGTNLKQGIDVFQEAITAFKKHNIPILAVASIYESAPFDGSIQPDYQNTAIQVDTELPPVTFLKILAEIEKELGRIPRQKWGPREIDIDILFWKDLVYESIYLTIPHYQAHKRPFVLYPVCEIAPHFIHPILLKTVAQLKDSLKFHSINKIVEHGWEHGR